MDSDNPDHPFAPLFAFYKIGNVIVDTCNATDVILPTRPYLEYHQHLCLSWPDVDIFEAYPELWRFRGRRYGTKWMERVVIKRIAGDTHGCVLACTLPYPPKNAKSVLRHFAALEIDSVPSFMCFVTQEFESQDAMDGYLNIEPRGRGTT